MKILIVSDAWYPQVSGVVRTLETLCDELRQLGHEVFLITPDQYRCSFPCPTYPEIRLVLTTGKRIGRKIEEIAPHYIHIATEGPLGVAARQYCVRKSWHFTTAYHTKFPEYVNARTRMPVSWTYRLMRWFHKPSAGVMVATESMARELTARGIENLREWSRGVDTEMFRPYERDLLDFPRPISMYVGRVAVEKNIRAFLDLQLEGTKVVVGDGPQFETLRRRYPHVRFVGRKIGEELARHYSAADVFVFPSLTDTFGLVMIEALACGTPVAAYPVAGPIDVIRSEEVGCLDEDLALAVRDALKCDREKCRDYALNFSWEQATQMFVENLIPIDHEGPLPGIRRRRRWNPWTRRRERRRQERERQLAAAAAGADDGPAANGNDAD